MPNVFSRNEYRDRVIYSQGVPIARINHYRHTDDSPTNASPAELDELTDKIVNSLNAAENMTLKTPQAKTGRKALVQHATLTETDIETLIEALERQIESTTSAVCVMKYREVKAKLNDIEFE